MFLPTLHDQRMSACSYWHRCVCSLASTQDMLCLSTYLDGWSTFFSKASSYIHTFSRLLVTTPLWSHLCYPLPHSSWLSFSILTCHCLTEPQKTQQNSNNLAHQQWKQTNKTPFIPPTPESVSYICFHAQPRQTGCFVSVCLPIFPAVRLNSTSLLLQSCQS